MNKVLVLGYFGYSTNQLDGQTVKTRDVYHLVQEKYDQVDFYDTQSFKYRKSSILCMLQKLVTCRHLVYLPAHNNLRILFPVIFLLSKLFRFKIHYFVVGGWLCEFIRNLPLHRWMLKRINVIYVETTELKHGLETTYSFPNIKTFPNFRFFDFEPTRQHSNKLRLVFMARINKMKGLDWIFELARYISLNSLDNQISISFYGPIHEPDRDYFETELTKYSFAEYKGVLQPEDIYITLNQYDVMLLPTHYFTEGLPGSVVDAYISGIPVIATKWRYAEEFIEDGLTGYIIPFQNGATSLIERVMLLEKDRNLLSVLQMNAFNKRNDFRPPYDKLIL